MRMTIKEALKRGIITKKEAIDQAGNGEVEKKSKSLDSFDSLMESANTAHYSFNIEAGEDGHAVSGTLIVDGFAAPSWNRILRLEWWDFSKLNKLIKQRIYEASLEARAKKQFHIFNSSIPINMHCHVIRPSLTDLDNVCVKHFIDGIVKSGGIKDDAPSFIKDYHATQEKSSSRNISKTIFSFSI